jgi:hypothetical protein
MWHGYPDKVQPGNKYNPKRVGLQDLFLFFGHFLGLTDHTLLSFEGKR